MSSGELLDIQPHELRFPFELRKQISCFLQLSNKTDNYVAFKVNMTNPKKYCVRPNDTGVVLPRSTCDVIVTMQAQKEAPAELQCKDEFLLQSVVASAETTTKDINPEMFNREAGLNVEECKLRVVYVAPPRPLSPVREGSDEDSSPRVSISENGRSNVELPGSSATKEQIPDALMKGGLLGLGGVLNSTIDGETQNGSPSTPPTHNPTSMPGRNHSSVECKNSGKQKMNGVSNQTGYTKGHYNGSIRCSSTRDIHLHIVGTASGREISDPPQPSRSRTSPPPPPTSASPGLPHSMRGGSEFSDSSLSHSSVTRRRKYCCKCDVESPLMTCKTLENYDRFYGCGMFKLYGKKVCNFFISVDEDMTVMLELKMKMKFFLGIVFFWVIVIVMHLVATQLLKWVLVFSI